MSGVISVRGLVKRYGSRTVVDRLDLEVPQGAIYAFLGDNGAGKTSTIKVLVGMHPPDGGTARILGQDCWEKAVPLRHRVGYVPERPRFYEWMTVEEIGWFTAAFHEPGFTDRYAEWVGRLGLDPAKRLKDLSKGGYARVGLSLALAPDPEVLILDEPTSGLDLLTRRDFLKSMVDMAGEGRTILISSHGISEVERIATHVGLIAKGQILFSGPLDTVKAPVHPDLLPVGRADCRAHRAGPCAPPSAARQTGRTADPGRGGGRGRADRRGAGRDRRGGDGPRARRHLRGRHAPGGRGGRGGADVIRAIFWKEFREQWVVALAILLFGGLALALMAEFADPAAGSGWLSLGAREVMPAGLAYLAGAVCGAILLADEKEVGTLEFLDTLPGRRRDLWIGKTLFGLTATVVQAALLGGLAAALEIDPRLTTLQYILILVLVGLVAFGWGMFGGALARSVLGAVFVGSLWIGPVAVVLTVVFTLLFGGRWTTRIHGAFYALTLSGIGLAAAGWWFTRPDRDRRRPPAVTPAGRRGQHVGSNVVPRGPGPGLAVGETGVVDYDRGRQRRAAWPGPGCWPRTPSRCSPGPV